jgi:hypothetical protein
MDGFKQLKIIFVALASGQIIYFLISLFLILQEVVQLNKDFSSIRGFLVPVVVVILVVSSKLLYNHSINSKVKETPINEKLLLYKTNNIIRFALLEMAGILTVTFYLLTGDFLYAGMFVILMGIFLVNFPSKERFISEFELPSFKEKTLNK